MSWNHTLYRASLPAYIFSSAMLWEGALSNVVVEMEQQ